MGLFTSKTLNTMDELLADELRDLYDAEHRIAEALPQMADAAHSTELRNAFQMHLRETEEQIKRLQRVFELVHVDAERETCEGAKGVIKEGSEFVSADGDPDVIDAALIAAAQRVEHYEMAGYGAARTFAQRLGHHEAAQLLQQTLDEEGATDKKLTQIAESSVNTRATK